MKPVNYLLGFVTVIMILAGGCTQQQDETVDLNLLPRFSLDNLNGVITQTGVEFDAGISSDGNGSLKITADKPATIHLFEVQDIDIENARLLYQARVRTRGVKGVVFLEMWVRIPDKGEFFTRNVHTAATGSKNWMTMEAPFFLKQGQNPDLVRLNLVINGTGTAWIDDIKLAKAPLPKK